MKIKYRIWSNKKKEFINTDFTLNREGILVAPNYDKVNQPISDEFEYQVWTGLLDCEGKEIYEGDIIREWEDGPITRVEYRQNTGGPHGGVYSGFVFTRMLREGEYVSESLGGGNNEVVIGNIYENPELWKTR